MIKLVKNNIYKVKRLVDNTSYYMVYLGKGNYVYNGNTYKQVWSLGAVLTSSLTRLRKQIYANKLGKFVFAKAAFNNESTIEVLYHIPLSSIHVPLSELQNYPPLLGLGNLPNFKSKPIPKKDYSKMRVLNG